MLSKDFVLGGRAVFTVANTTTKNRYTFKVRRKVLGVKTCFFAYVLTGPDNTSSYTYLGTVDAQVLQAYVTRSSRYAKESRVVKVLNWALAHVEAQRDLPTGYELHHEGKCGRCGRALTVPESIKTGIGPECARIMGIAA